MDNGEQKLPGELGEGEQTTGESPTLTTNGAVVSTVEPNVLETEIQMTSERISSDTNVSAPKAHPNDVRFKVKYAKNFEGEKNFEDGSIQVVSKESGEHFAKLGMGTIIK